MSPRDNLTFTVKTKDVLPRLPFSKIKNKVLGTRSEVSVVIVGDLRSKALNRCYRGKNAPANILTFPLGVSSGEIFLNPKQIRRDAPRFNMSYRDFFALVFIHGLLHLKGSAHSSRMEREEARLVSLFT